MPIRRRRFAQTAGRLLPVVLVLTFTWGFGPGRAADDEAQAQSEAAIRRLLDAQVEAWNRKDLDGFLDGYWRSPEVVFQSGGDH